MPVYRLVAWTRFRDPVARVWDVKTDLDCLAEEFPLWARFTVEDPQRLVEAVRGGRPCEMRGWVSPLRIPWPVHMDESRPGEFFRDRSENALFQRFQHLHRFEPTRDGCRYVDVVTFEPAPLALAATARFLERLFVHRHRASARHLHPEAHTLARTALRQAFDGELDHVFPPREP